MAIRERWEWSERVLKTILALTQPGDRLTFQAGRRYYEHLIDPLKATEYHIELPLQGMPIGKRLKWLNLQVETHSRT